MNGKTWCDSASWSVIVGSQKLWNGGLWIDAIVGLLICCHTKRKRKKETSLNILSGSGWLPLGPDAPELTTWKRSLSPRRVTPMHARAALRIIYKYIYMCVCIYFVFFLFSLVKRFSLWLIWPHLFPPPPQKRRISPSSFFPTFSNPFFGNNIGASQINWAGDYNYGASRITRLFERLDLILICVDVFSISETGDSSDDE